MLQQVLGLREDFKSVTHSLAQANGGLGATAENLNISNGSQRFLDLWFVGSLTPIALEILGDFLKSLLPSQKKKKKGSVLQDQLSSDIVQPLKGLVKETIALYSQPEAFDLLKREEELHLLHKKLSGEDICPQTVVNEIIAKKVSEVAKEEKLQRERQRELSTLVSKKFKELLGSFAGGIL